jgi:hypothetical protein
MEAELDVPVVQHDDNSKPKMHDLNIVYPGQRLAAVEIGAAVDAQATELWNILNGRGRWIEPDLVGGWGVTVKPNARQLRRDLPPFLRALEGTGIRKFPDANSIDPIRDVGIALPGVVRAMQSGTKYPGSIYVYLDLPLDQAAGYVSDSGDAVAQWLGDFLHDDARTDLRRKLAHSGSDERHAFVLVSPLSGAPFSVTDPLMAEDVLPPAIEPALPAEVTDVWVASTWASGVGFRWASSSRGWTAFGKPPPGDQSDA